MTEISLGPLDVSEIRDLMSKVLEYDQNAIPDPLCSDIFQTTGGLPVYVVQLLENIKRKKTVELNEEGLLRWTAEGLEDKVRTNWFGRWRLFIFKLMLIFYFIHFRE